MGNFDRFINEVCLSPDRSWRETAMNIEIGKLWIY